MSDIMELAGIYNADGGLRGEAAYIVGHLLGRAHCSLCDITHSPVRRKAEWDRRAAELPVPFRLLHRNELEPDLLAAAGTYPVVMARADDGWRMLVSPEELDACEGSVAALFALVNDRVLA